MQDNDWIWVQVDPDPYAHLDAREAWMLRADGSDAYLVLLQPDDLDHDADPVWQVYAVMSDEDEGFTGLEPLDSHPALDAARTAVDRDREQTLRVLREHRH